MIKRPIPVPVPKRRENKLRRYLLDTRDERMKRRATAFSNAQRQGGITVGCNHCGAIFCLSSDGGWMLADGQDEHEILTSAEVAAFLENPSRTCWEEQ